MAVLDTPNAFTAFPPRVTSVTVSTVASLATSATLLVANTSRLGAVIHNTDANALFIKYGATATVSPGGYTYKIPSDGTWEMPLHVVYYGIIDGIWAADGAGSASITELA